MLHRTSKYSPFDAISFPPHTQDANLRGLWGFSSNAWYKFGPLKEGMEKSQRRTRAVFAVLCDVTDLLYMDEHRSVMQLSQMTPMQLWACSDFEVTGSKGLFDIEVRTTATKTHKR
jgi:hypothetical protein